jgi:hypothetical protein
MPDLSGFALVTSRDCEPAGGSGRRRPGQPQRGYYMIAQGWPTAERPTLGTEQRNFGGRVPKPPSTGIPPRPQLLRDHEWAAKDSQEAGHTDFAFHPTRNQDTRNQDCRGFRCQSPEGDVAVHPRPSGPVWQRREDDDDLHPRSELRRSRRPQSRGWSCASARGAIGRNGLSR